ncbi:MAG: hypothetical protein OXP68_01740 [Anaerolineaceae bacterium]|nr:hypothetical protein [Anaerolineaceae bacterium]MDE0328625.1 hypothetical protein [Anaerolineaceae bacterium]MDE0610867.1 hypothetical protein [Anaerolineaceae bacterium]
MNSMPPQAFYSSKICWRGVWTLGLLRLNEEISDRMVQLLEQELADLYRVTEAKLRRESRDVDVDLRDLKTSYQDVCGVLGSDFLDPADVGV